MAGLKIIENMFRVDHLYPPEVYAKLSSALPILAKQFNTLEWYKYFMKDNVGPAIVSLMKSGIHQEKVTQ